MSPKPLIFPVCQWIHDPSGQPIDYTIPLPIAATDTLVGVTVVAVDDDDVALVGDSMVITNISFAIASGFWEVTFWASGGTPGTIYKLRCRWTLSDSRGSDKTVRLRVGNT